MLTDPGGGMKSAIDRILIRFSTGGVDGFEDLEEHPIDKNKHRQVKRDKAPANLENWYIVNLAKG